MKKRILTAKRGSALLFLPILDILGSLISGQRGENDKRQQSRATCSKSNVTIVRWNGRGLYLPTYVNTDADCISARINIGQGVAAKKKKNAKKMIKKLSGATTVQLNELAKHMRVPHFRGVFIHNMLPTSDTRRNESDIVNLDDVITDSTRPVASSRTQRNNRVMYFDSFGNL